jgi:cell wall-associated NlpC family hydrolase
LALLAAVPAFADPSISSKRAQAQQVMAQVDQLGASLESAIAQYQYATIRLQRIQHELRTNRRELVIAKANLKTSQRIIAKRLVTLYRQPSASSIEVILGAKSLDDMMNRLDTEKSVTKLDANVLREVKSSRAAVEKSGKVLAQARAAQSRLVAERAAKKQEIESKLAEQKRLLSSIKGQISQLEAAAQARQLQLAREAQSRLAQQRVEQQQQQDSTIVGISASTPGADTVVAPPSHYTGVVAYAMSQLGVPYVWGGASPGGFDCSGLVMWAYAQVGVSLPHSSYAQWGYGVPVSADQLEPGDLVFFDGLGHVGLYIGGGQFIEAPHTGAFVQISNLADRMGDYVGARRIL